MEVIIKLMISVYLLLVMGICYMTLRSNELTNFTIGLAMYLVFMSIGGFVVMYLHQWRFIELVAIKYIKLMYNNGRVN